MGLWITTKQLLLHQDAELLHRRNQESGKRGIPTGSMVIRWVPQCIITGVKMSTSRPRPVNALWILSISPPPKYQMPQLSSTDRLIMAAKDMTDPLQNPHPEVPFASVGDDTISALVDLAALFKLK
jgi:hypothetical protein